MKTLNPSALGKSLGVLSGLTMLVMALLALAGFYSEAYEIMMKFHITASLTPLGIILGMIEAAICGYICGYLLAWFYNKFDS